MKKILSGLILIILPVLLLSCRAFAEEELAIAADRAVILFMEGDVKVKSFNTDKWIDAAIDMVLSKGDSLKTGIDSWAEIGFGEEFANVVKVKENTLVELIDLGPVKIGLLKGELRSLVESLIKDTTFEIKTPTAICGARGTGWDTNTDGTKVIVDAYEDEVYFYPLSKEGETVVDPIIRAGQRGILEDPTRPIIIVDLSRERLTEWNKWKKDFLERVRIERDILKRTQRGIEGEPPTQERAPEERPSDRLSRRRRRRAVKRKDKDEDRDKDRDEDEDEESEEGESRGRRRARATRRRLREDRRDDFEGPERLEELEELEMPESLDKIKKVASEAKRQDKIKEVAEDLERLGRIEKLEDDMDKLDRIKKLQKDIKKQDKIKKIEKSIEKRDKVRKILERDIEKRDKIRKIEREIDRDDRREKMKERFEKIRKKTKRIQKRLKKTPKRRGDDDDDDDD